MAKGSPNRVQTWLQYLQRHGYRITAARRAVVTALAESDQPLEAAEIFRRARAYCASLGLVTVYRTLDALAELGLVERVHRPQGCTAFVAAAPGHQHMLVCERCGQVAFFSGDDLNDLIRRVAAESGFQIADHWLQLFGRCPQCQESAS